MTTSNRINEKPGGTGDMKDSKKILKVIEKISNEMDSLSDRMDSLSDRVDTISDRVDTISDRMDVMEVKMTKMETDMTEMKADMTEIKQRVGSLENRTNRIELIIENNISKSIELIAEGHLDICRKLDESLKITDKTELMGVRLNYLDGEVLKIKDHVNMPA